MVAYFTTIITIGMLFTGITLYEKFNQTAEKYATQSVDQLITQVKYSLDTYTRNMMDVSNTLYYKIIKNHNITDNNFTPQMNVIQTTNNHIAGLAIFKDTGELIAASKYSKIKETTDVTRQEWFESAMQKPENVHFSSPHRQNLFEEYEPWVVSLSRVVSLNQDGSIIQGILLVDMNLTGIKNICDPIAQGENGDIYIIAPNGEVVYEKEGSDIFANGIEKMGNLKEGIKVLEDKETLSVIKTAGYTGWKIVALWQLDKVLITFTEVKNFLILVLLIGLCHVYIRNAVYFFKAFSTTL